MYLHDCIGTCCNVSPAETSVPHSLLRLNASMEGHGTRTCTSTVQKGTVSILFLEYMGTDRERGTTQPEADHVPHAVSRRFQQSPRLGEGVGAKIINLI